MSCNFYVHNDPKAGIKYISGTTCSGSATATTLSFGQQICMNDSRPIINLNNLQISGSCLAVTPTPTPTTPTYCYFNELTYYTSPFQCPNDGLIYDDIYGVIKFQVTIGGFVTTNHPDTTFVVSNGTNQENVVLRNGQSFIEYTYLKKNFVYTATGCIETNYPDYVLIAVSPIMIECFVTPTPTPTFTSTPTTTLTPSPTETPACLEIGNGFDNTVFDILVENDGKLVVVGAFKNYNGSSYYGIIRLNNTGTIDTSFQIGNGFTKSIVASSDDETIPYVNKIIQYTGNTYLVSGNFRQYSGNTYNVPYVYKGVAVLQNDGNPIQKATGIGSFPDVYTGPETAWNRNNRPYVISYGLILSGSYFYSLSQIDWVNNGDINICPTGFYRVNNTSFQKDTSWNPYSPSYSCGTVFPPPNPYSSLKLLQQSDGKFIVLGAPSYNSISNAYVYRINTDGSYDSTYLVGTGPNFGDGSTTGALQSDGKLIMAGSFTSYDGTSCRGVIRLNTDGTIDNTWSYSTVSGFTGVSSTNIPYDVIIQSTGKVIVVGDFENYSGYSCNRVVRLNTNGTIDTTFNSGTGFDATVRVVKQDSIGNLFFGGEFLRYNGDEAVRLVKTSSNGIIKDCTIIPAVTQTQTVTPTQTATPTRTPTQTQTNTPSITATNTLTPSVTTTNTPSVSITASQTSTPTTSITPTSTQTKFTYSVREYDANCAIQGATLFLNYNGTLAVGWYCISGYGRVRINAKVFYDSTRPLMTINSGPYATCGPSIPCG
jgi:uncharacterized delta-60 repeat protein